MGSRDGLDSVMPAPATLALFALATALLTLPQFLNPTEPIAPQVAVLGVIYVAIAIVVDTTYVLTASAVSRRFMSSRVAQRRTGRVAAATYFALGIAAAATGTKKL